MRRALDELRVASSLLTKVVVDANKCAKELNEISTKIHETFMRAKHN